MQTTLLKKKKKIHYCIATAREAMQNPSHKWQLKAFSVMCLTLKIAAVA